MSGGTPRTFNVQPFPVFFPVLWPRLTSVVQACITTHPCSFGTRVSLRPLFNRSPRVRCANCLFIYLSDIQLLVSDSIGLCFVVQTHPPVTASSASCSSGRIYRWLPSDSSSQRTPLPLVNASHYQGAFGACTQKFAPMPGAHNKKPPQMKRLLEVLSKKIFITVWSTWSNTYRKYQPLQLLHS